MGEPKKLHVYMWHSRERARSPIGSEGALDRPEKKGAQEIRQGEMCICARSGLSKSTELHRPGEDSDERCAHSLSNRDRADVGLEIKRCC